MAARFRRSRRHASRHRLLGARSRIDDARVHDRVQHVEDEVDQDKLDREQQQGGLADREVAVVDGIDQQQTEPG